MEPSQRLRKELQTTTPDSPAPAPDPKGTVLKTLLLTDLVGSTRLTEQVGDRRASEIWARHDHLARELLNRHGGREIDKSDGFLQLFDRPSAGSWRTDAAHAGCLRLARRAAVESDTGDTLEWLAHGAYLLSGIARPYAARFSPDGRRILTQSQQDGLGVWDLEGNELVTLTPAATPYTVAWSPDGSLIAGSPARRLGPALGGTALARVAESRRSPGGILRGAREGQR